MAEEAQNILGLTAENLDTETRSWGKDETFLHAEPLAVKLRAVSEKYGLDDSDPEVRELISHATQERLKDLVEKLSVIAEHRTEPLRVSSCQFYDRPPGSNSASYRIIHSSNKRPTIELSCVFWRSCRRKNTSKRKSARRKPC